MGVHTKQSRAAEEKREDRMVSNERREEKMWRGEMNLWLASLIVTRGFCLARARVGVSTKEHQAHFEKRDLPESTYLGPREEKGIWEADMSTMCISWTFV